MGSPIRIIVSGTGFASLVKAMIRCQKTLKTPLEFSGIGLHTGLVAHVRLSPAPPDTGYTFIRKDTPSLPIKGIVNNVISTYYSSTIGCNGHRIHTVEHLLAALAGLEIDNVYIEIDAPEIPIMDGSAYPFVEKLMGAGTVTQDRIRPCIKLRNPVIIKEEDKFIRIDPAPYTAITYIMDYDHPLLGKQIFSYYYSSESFIKDIAPARTFGFLRDVAHLHAQGLGKGGSLDNVVILSDMDVLNGEGLRYENEPIRHKVLDLIGDMSLLPCSFTGHIVAYKSGHDLNRRLVLELMEGISKNRGSSILKVEPYDNKWISKELHILP